MGGDEAGVGVWCTAKLKLALVEACSFLLRAHPQQQAAPLQPRMLGGQLHRPHRSSQVQEEALGRSSATATMLP